MRSRNRIRAGAGAAAIALTCLLPLTLAGTARAANDTWCRDWTPPGLWAENIQLRPCITLMYEYDGYYQVSGQSYYRSPSTDIDVYVQVGTYGLDGTWHPAGPSAEADVKYQGSVATKTFAESLPICWYTRTWWSEATHGTSGYAESPANCYP